MTIELRQYQEDAVSACLKFWQLGGRNGLLVLPTGAGKSLTMAALIQRMRQQFHGVRPLILAHRGGLIEQNCEALHKLWPDAPAGIVSAKLRKNQCKTPITFATMLSAKNRLAKLGTRQLIMIDEAQLISHRDDTTYRKIISHFEREVPDLCVLGVTATPYRLSTGRLDEDYGKPGDERYHKALFEGVIFEKPIRELLNEGYLAPLVTIAPDTHVSGEGVRKSGGDYTAKALQEAVDVAQLNEAAVQEIVSAGRERKAWLVFCAGIEHAEHIAELLRAEGIDAAAVHSELEDSEQERIVGAYKAGELRCLVNVSILTEGFDAPQTDLLAILRPTLSLGLHIQILGRGMRLAEGKDNCLVLDFARNSEKLGPIDQADGAKQPGAGAPPPGKTCPECRNIIAAGFLKCPHCGFDFPPPDLRITGKASDAAIFSDQVSAVWKNVSNVALSSHTSRASGINMLRVDYQCGLTEGYSDFVCLEHEPSVSDPKNFAGNKARAWWRKHAGGSEPPVSVDEALARAHELRLPGRIAVQKRGKYHNIVDEDFSVTA